MVHDTEDNILLYRPSVSKSYCCRFFVCNNPPSTWSLALSGNSIIWNQLVSAITECILSVPGWHRWYHHYCKKHSHPQSHVAQVDDPSTDGKSRLYPPFFGSALSPGHLNDFNCNIVIKSFWLNCSITLSFIINSNPQFNITAYLNHLFRRIIVISTEITKGVKKILRVFIKS